ncbi:MAG TPA: sugar phosphate nucleotidyltransferase [Pyrinomonadaceae bacterium]
MLNRRLQVLSSVLVYFLLSITNRPDFHDKRKHLRSVRDNTLALDRRTNYDWQIKRAPIMNDTGVVIMDWGVNSRAVRGKAIMDHLRNGRQSSFGESSRAAELPGSRRADRWAVILAGGDGTRLRPLTRLIAGDERPKQFCPVIGDQTLLDQTRNRVALAVRPDQTIFVVTQHHARFYKPLLGDVRRQQLVAQPKNVGTASAILYGLLRLSQVAPSSSVAFFPSDHYFSDDDRFMSHVESAFEAAQVCEDLVILLGIQPDGPEVEYGWIEPASPGLMKNPDALCRVHRFWEKPTTHMAHALMDMGCLWNSFVMVGRVSAFLEMIRRAAPELYGRFDAVRPVLNTADEGRAIDGLYAQLRETNFSQQVLAARPEDLAVLPVSGLRWSDLGQPGRVLSTMADIGLEPSRGAVLGFSHAAESRGQRVNLLTRDREALTR